MLADYYNKGLISFLLSGDYQNFCIKLSGLDIMLNGLYIKSD